MSATRLRTLSATDRAPILRFAPYLRPVRRVVAAGLAASVVQALLQWIAPWPLKVIFDSVLSTHRVPAFFGWLPPTPVARLGLLTAFSLAVAGLIALTDFASDRWVAQAGQRVVSAIRCDLFDHLQRQALAFHHKRPTGDLMSRLDGDTQDIQNLTVDVLPTVANNALTLVGYSVILIVVNPVLGAVSLVMAPTMFVLVRRYMARIKAAQRVALAAQGDAAGVAQEVLSSLTLVQAFGGEPRELARFGRANHRQLDASLRAVVLEAAFSPLVALAMAVITAAVVYVGARSVLTGELTPGDLLVFAAYLRGMYAPVRQLAKLAGIAGRGQAAAERVLEVLEIDEAIPEPVSPRRLGRARGALRLEAVSYAYPGRPAALRSVDLEIPAGSRLGLVGRIGSGKSTILRLLPRLADPTEGRICLDGVDLRAVALTELRNQMTFVPQEPYLLRATVWENIAYGLEHPCRPAAIEAARRAGVDEVLESLPEGYDTAAAERGAALSGGQRQCVALARAMARDAPILLLDEPTTGLDPEMEAVLLESLRRVSAGRTTVLVTHHLAAVRDADRVAVLEGGRVAEYGPPGELARAGRTYARLAALGSTEPDSVALAR